MTASRMFPPSYPLAPMQRGMLFHHLSSERQGVDLEQIICRLPEDLDLARLTHAWQVAVARHEVLRCSFRWEDLDEPVQIVHAPQDLGVEFHDCSESDFETQEARLEDYLQEDRRRGFDFDRPPLMRLAVFRNGPDDHILIWTFPHILLDGRSFPIVLGDVFDHYDSPEAVNQEELTRAPSYRTHVEWINSRDWTEAEAFWRDRLAGFTSATTLPGRDDGSAAESRGERELRLPKDLSDRLRQLAEEHSVSMNNIVQGAWALLLSRHAGERDVVFGATRACRSSGVPEAKDTVGLFINTLPVRVDVDPAKPAHEWLSGLRSREREVYPHEHSPLMDVQTWNDAAAGKPLFESIIVYDNWLLSSHMQARGGTWQNRVCELREQASYPLVLYGYGEDELLFKLAYDIPRFDREFAGKLLDQFAVLLEGFAADPRASLGSLPILTAEEKKQLFETWNSTETEFEESHCIHELIEAQVAKRPDDVALVFENEQITYRELDAQANQLARKLQQCGVGSETLVGVCVERSIALVTSVLAIHKAGGAYLPLAPEYPSERISYMLQDAAAPILLTQEHLNAHLGEHRAKV
ncbi:MAG: condensation domain-containing protein, partial [Planctomycetota bacterium]